MLRQRRSWETGEPQILSTQASHWPNPGVFFNDQWRSCTNCARHFLFSDVGISCLAILKHSLTPCQHPIGPKTSWILGQNTGHCLAITPQNTMSDMIEDHTLLNERWHWTATNWLSHGHSSSCQYQPFDTTPLLSHILPIWNATVPFHKSHKTQVLANVDCTSYMLLCTFHLYWRT